MYHTDTEHAHTQMWYIIVRCNKCAPEREEQENGKKILKCLLFLQDYQSDVPLKWLT